MSSFYWVQSLRFNFDIYLEFCTNLVNTEVRKTVNLMFIHLSWHEPECWWRGLKERIFLLSRAQIFIGKFKKRLITNYYSLSTKMGRSPGEGNGNSVQYSYLESSMDQGAWWATVHGFAKSRTQLNDFTSLHIHQNNHLGAGKVAVV